MTERFDAAWLSLREPFDHAARSVALARRFADHLPPRRPRLVDLGAGTGSLFRFLAPIIGRGQDWTLIDSDPALLDEAFGRTAAWARRQGLAATSPGDALLVYTPRGTWRMQGLVLDATTPDAANLPEADAVVCSALLDLMSANWLERLIDSLRAPFLACMTVDGRDSWLPRHPADAVVTKAFRRDQRRDKGTGPASATAASSAALRAFAARGFATASAPTDWHVPRTSLRMLRALIEGTAQAARNAAPARDASIAAWESTRLDQALRARLAIRIGHRDILAIPPGG